MPPKHPAALETVDAQVRMFALHVGQGLFCTRAELARRTGIAEATLQGWAGGAAMPVWAVNVLAEHLPGEAINLLFACSGRRIAPIDQECANWDDLASSVSRMTFEISSAANHASR